MKKQNALAAYVLIGIGAFFLLRQLKLPIFTDFYSWPTLLIIIGLALLIHSYTAKNYQNLFGGTIILALGIHFHGLEHYSFWIDHWAVYLLIVGIAFVVRFLHTKKGLLPGIILIVISIVFIFSIKLPVWLDWIYDVFALFERFWPIALIIFGLYLLRRKK